MAWFFNLILLKVRYSQNELIMSSFEPKTKRKYFCISDLASRMGQTKKAMAYYHAALRDHSSITSSERWVGKVRK